MKTQKIQKNKNTKKSKNRTMKKGGFFGIGKAIGKRLSRVKRNSYFPGATAKITDVGAKRSTDGTSKRWFKEQHDRIDVLVLRTNADKLSLKPKNIEINNVFHRFYKNPPEDVLTNEAVDFKDRIIKFLYLLYLKKINHTIDANKINWNTDTEKTGVLDGVPLKPKFTIKQYNPKFADIYNFNTLKGVVNNLLGAQKNENKQEVIKTITPYFNSMITNIQDLDLPIFKNCGGLSLLNNYTSVKRVFVIPCLKPTMTGYGRGVSYDDINYPLPSMNQLEYIFLKKINHDYDSNKILDNVDLYIPLDYRLTYDFLNTTSNQNNALLKPGKIILQKDQVGNVVQFAEKTDLQNRFKKPDIDEDGLYINDVGAVDMFKAGGPQGNIRIPRIIPNMIDEFISGVISINNIKTASLSYLDSKNCDFIAKNRNENKDVSLFNFLKHTDDNEFKTKFNRADNKNNLDDLFDAAIQNIYIKEDNCSDGLERNCISNESYSSKYYPVKYKSEIDDNDIFETCKLIDIWNFVKTPDGELTGNTYIEIHKNKNFGNIFNHKKRIYNYGVADNGDNMGIHAAKFNNLLVNFKYQLYREFINLFGDYYDLETGEGGVKTTYIKSKIQLVKNFTRMRNALKTFFARRHALNILFNLGWDFKIDIPRVSIPRVRSKGRLIILPFRFKKRSLNNGTDIRELLTHSGESVEVGDNYYYKFTTHKHDNTEYQYLSLKETNPATFGLSIYLPMFYNDCEPNKELKNLAFGTSNLNSKEKHSLEGRDILDGTTGKLPNSEKKYLDQEQYLSKLIHNLLQMEDNTITGGGTEYNVILGIVNDKEYNFNDSELKREPKKAEVANDAGQHPGADANNPEPATEEQGGLAMLASLFEQTGPANTGATSIDELFEDDTIKKYLEIHKAIQPGMVNRLSSIISSETRSQIQFNKQTRIKEIMIEKKDVMNVEVKKYMNNDVVDNFNVHKEALRVIYKNLNDLMDLSITREKFNQQDIKNDLENIKANIETNMKVLFKEELNTIVNYPILTELLIPYREYAATLSNNIIMRGGKKRMTRRVKRNLRKTLRKKNNRRKNKKTMKKRKSRKGKK